jgi:2-methylcitrate dehydratase PrpD
MSRQHRIEPGPASIVTTSNVPTTLAEHIAEFVVTTGYDDLSPALLEHAKLAVIDTIGVGMAGSSSDGCVRLHQYVASLGCGGTATPLGTSIRTLPRFAALANAAAINTYDFDDTYHPSRTHTSGPVLAAVLAQAEHARSSGKEVLAAFCIGSEVTCKISEAISKEHFQRGFHITGTCGIIGAAAGVARLLRASTSETLTAIGIAASHAAGLRENFGSTAKTLHAGHAAEIGVVANSLAALGFTAAPTVLEGPRGFFVALGGGYDDSVVRARLGNPWSYVLPGVATKPYPSGNISHPAMWKMLELVMAHDIKPEDVNRVHVRTNRLLPLNLTFHQPKTGLQAQLSMEFCVATMLALRRAGLPEFTDAVVNSPALRGAMAKVDFTTYGDAEAKDAGYAFLTTFLDIEMNDGRRFAERVDAAKGSAALPMDNDEIIAKFHSCLDFVDWPKDRANRCIELLDRLEQLDDVHGIVNLLRR